MACCREFGIDPATVPAAELDELNLAWHRLDPWPDAVAGLTRLKTRYIIAPLSNGNIILMLDMAKRAGLPWDAILGAEVAQAYKTSPEAYLRTADVLACRRTRSASSPRTTTISERRARLRLPHGVRLPPGENGPGAYAARAESGVGYDRARLRRTGRSVRNLSSAC